MMRDTKYEGNFRPRSPSPPRHRKRLSSPPVRHSDRGNSSPRRHDRIDTREERRGGSYSRRDYVRRDERGNRVYRRSYDRGDRDFERNERGSRDYGRRNSDRREKRYNGSFDYGGVRISDFDGDGDTERYKEIGDANVVSIRSRNYQSNNDAGYSGRVYKYGGEGMLQENSTSAKFQWDHLLYETKQSEGFKGSLHHGTGGNEVKTGLDYGYQRSKYFDEGRAGFALDSKTVSMEAERARDYSSSYQMDLGGLSKSSSQADAGGGFIPAPPTFPNSSLRKDKDLHFLDKPYLGDGPLAEAQLAREANPLRYSRVDTDFVASFSQAKAFDVVPHGSFYEDVPGSVIPEGVKFSGGVNTNYFNYDDYGAKSRTRSPIDCRERLDDFKSYSRSYIDAIEERSSNLSHPEVGRIERSAMVKRPIEFYGKVEGIGEQYDHQDMSTVGILDSNNDKLDGSSTHGYLRGNRLWDPPTSLGQSTCSNYDAHDLSNANGQNLHNQDFESPRPLHEKDFYDGHHRSSILRGLHYDYTVTGSSWSPKKGADRLSPRVYYSSLGNVDVCPQQELLSDDIRFPRSSKVSKQIYDTIKQPNKHDSMLYNRGGAGESWRDKMDSNTLSNKMKLTNSKKGKARKRSSLMVHRQQSRSNRVDKPHQRFGTQDIKKRMGPNPQKAYVLERLTQKFKPSIKKRLGPSPQKNHFTLPPWIKNVKAPKLPSSKDASGGSHLPPREETKELSVTPAKPEPPENSEEFRQLVRSAFFKFIKKMNETPAKRIIYNEQGEAGSLKCIVCGSSSEVFENTESLATHAFQSQKDGLRSQHLGFHKALCALMGWSAEAVNSVWICETLSHTANLCIKEDLILWPPVVIVHNSSITNQNPDRQIVITLEKLEAKLRDMGYGDKMKVHRGKPANQSIMVAQFGGTLSGLLEAERLHRMYSEIKRGRTEFQQQVKSCNKGSRNEEAKEKLINNLENILYGYLGTAEDLHKLDFDMKKRCVIKSKKDIQSIAEAPLETQ